MKASTKFKPGQSGNPKGRPKGTPNKSTSELKEAIKSVLDSELGKIQKHLNQLEPKERLDFITKLLPYILPKQNQVEQTAKLDLDVKRIIDYDKLSDEALEEIIRAGYKL